MVLLPVPTTMPHRVDRILGDWCKGGVLLLLRYHWAAFYLDHNGTWDCYITWGVVSRCTTHRSLVGIIITHFLNHPRLPSYVPVRINPLFFFPTLHIIRYQCHFHSVTSSSSTLDSPSMCRMIYRSNTEITLPQPPPQCPTSRFRSSAPAAATRQATRFPSHRHNREGPDPCRCVWPSGGR